MQFKNGFKYWFGVFCWLLEWSAWYPHRLKWPATQGILIRVDAPKANEWVAIGDTIRFGSCATPDRLDDGFRLAVVDSTRCRRRHRKTVPDIICEWKIRFRQ